MKKILISIFILISGIAYGQAPSLNLYSAAGQTQIKAYVKYVVDSAFKVQSGVDAVQNSRLTKLELNDTLFFDKKYFPIVGKSISLNLDSIANYIKVPTPVIDLSAITSSIGLLDGRVAKVETGYTDAVVRLNSLEGWRTNAINDLKNINTAILKIPKIATSTSTSTTTTTTTTTLQ